MATHTQPRTEETPGIYRACAQSSPKPSWWVEMQRSPSTCWAQSSRICSQRGTLSWLSARSTRTLRLSNTSSTPRTWLKGLGNETDSSKGSVSLSHFHSAHRRGDVSLSLHLLSPVNQRFYVNSCITLI